MLTDGFVIRLASANLDIIITHNPRIVKQEFSFFINREVLGSLSVTAFSVALFERGTVQFEFGLGRVKTLPYDFHRKHGID